VDVRIKRIYDPAAADDGQRVLVDRLWPRGVTKEAAKLDVWLRDAAPSHDLRVRFHGERKEGDWEEFCRLYAVELEGHPTVVAELRRLARRGRLTLLYASRDEERNNAEALRRHLVASSPEPRR
jgi:uncharacterized protein YeaO (DUF488 family)